MIYDYPTILKMAMYKSGQSVSSPSIDATVLASIVDDAHSILSDTFLQLRPDLLSTYYDLTTTGVKTYNLTDYITTLNYDRVLCIEDITDSDNPLPTIPFDWQDRHYYYYNNVQQSREPWNIRDQTLELPNAPAGNIFRIWYCQRPTSLFYGTSAGSGATTVTFPATATYGEVRIDNDYYIGMRICYAGQIRKITDYVGSTKIATINTAWTSQPTTTGTISLISPLPDRYHFMIPDVAARIMKVGRDDNDQFLQRYITENIERIEVSMSKKQTQTPEYVRKISRS